MTLSRPCLRAFALCLVVVGAMALGTASAQAEVGAKWLILTSGGIAKTGEELPAQLKGELESNTTIFLTKILGIRTEFSCTGLELVGISLEGEGKLTNGGKFRFTGCVTLVDGEKNALCTP